MTKYDKEEIGKAIKKIWDSVNFNFEEKLVTAKTGVERVIWFVISNWSKINKNDGWIMAKHYFEEDEWSPEDIAQDLFFNTISESLKKLNKLHNSFWERLKFLFLNR